MNKTFHAAWGILHASAAALAFTAVMAHVGSTVYHLRRWRLNW